LLYDEPPAVGGCVGVTGRRASADDQFAETAEAGRRLGLSIHGARISSERDFEDAFAALVRERSAALIVMSSVYFNTYRDRLVELATRYRIPTSYELREFVQAGG
jgi:putative tryptophan/tyrosine transport system substrate-binding protein